MHKVSVLLNLCHNWKTIPYNSALNLSIALNISIWGPHIKQGENNYVRTGMYLHTHSNVIISSGDGIKDWRQLIPGTK